jgi:hypothetical protein
MINQPEPSLREQTTIANSNKTTDSLDIPISDVNQIPEPKDKLEGFIWQIITDYITYENRGYTTAQSIESTIAYDLPNLKQLLENYEEVTVRPYHDLLTKAALALEIAGSPDAANAVRRNLAQLTHPQAGEGEGK